MAFLVGVDFWPDWDVRDTGPDVDGDGVPGSIAIDGLYKVILS